MFEQYYIDFEMSKTIQLLVLYENYGEIYIKKYQLEGGGGKSSRFRGLENAKYRDVLEELRFTNSCLCYVFNLYKKLTLTLTSFFSQHKNDLSIY